MSLMPLEVILHVGLHKTATSTLQYHLSMLSKLLYDVGICFPAELGENHSVPLCVLADYKSDAYARKFEIRNIDSYNENTRFLLAESVDDNVKTLILSGESLSLLDASALERLKLILLEIFPSRFLIFKIMVYVREPLSFLVSLAQQHIKSSGELALPNDLHNLFSNRIQKFIDVFGSDSVCVYKFEEAVKQEGNILEHFLTYVGAEGIHTAVRMNSRNVSLSQLAADLFLELKKVKGKEFNRNRYKCLLEVKGERFDLDVSVKQRYIESFEQEVAWLKEKFDINYDKPVILSNNVSLRAETLEEEQIVSLKNVESKLKKDEWEIILSYLERNYKGLSLQQKRFFNIKRMF